MKKVTLSIDPLIEVYNGDCMEGMEWFGNKHFDLAIVDPPYGLNFGKFNRTNKDSNGNRYKADKYKNGNWDKEIPEKVFFNTIIAKATHQIVWGGNYFPILWAKGCKCFIFWYKQNPVPNFADGELAWTSFDKPSACFDYRYYGNLEGKTNTTDKIHPTQKPVALYKWVLHNYAKPSQTILDTHLGSMSIAIACWEMGFPLVGFEKDPDYFEAGVKRVKTHIGCNQKLF